MPDTNVLQRPTLRVDEGVIQLVERVEPLDDVPEYSVLPVKVVDPVRERDEELAAAPAVRAVERGSDGHRDRALLLVLQSREELRREVSRHGWCVRGL